MSCHQIFHLLTMRYLHFLALTLLSTVLVGCATLQGRIERDRYYAPNGEFSVRLVADFEPNQETTFSQQTVVDFLFKGTTASFKTFGLQTIEWLTLPKAISPDEFRDGVSNVAAEHVAKRFGALARFQLRDAKLTQTANGQSYLFVASGTFKDQPAYWLGSVIHFGDRIAFVSLVVPNTAISANMPGSVADMPGGFLKWAESVRREK